MEQPLVSIILPTYNVERFLRKCLDSLANQTYKNVEVIIVIDGATDSSHDIAKEYCQKYPHYSVYWQENQGSGPARNNGLSRAKGELIMFVDPDDWCEPDYVENMVRYQMENNCDLVITRDILAKCTSAGEILQYNNKSCDFEMCESQDQARKDYARLLTSDLISSPHAKLYKKSIIDANSVSFPALRRSQDIAFNYRYYSYINNYCISSKNGYVYRIIPSERSTKIRKDYYSIISVLYNDIQSMYKNWGMAFESASIPNHFFTRLCGHFYLTKPSAQEIRDILSDSVLQELVKDAQPIRKDRKICHSLLKGKKYRMASLAISFFSLVKKFA